LRWQAGNRSFCVFVFNQETASLELEVIPTSPVCEFGTNAVTKEKCRKTRSGSLGAPREAVTAGACAQTGDWANLVVCVYMYKWKSEHLIIVWSYLPSCYKQMWQKKNAKELSIARCPFFVIIMEMSVMFHTKISSGDMGVLCWRSTLTTLASRLRRFGVRQRRRNPTEPRGDASEPRGDTSKRDDFLKVKK